MNSLSFSETGVPADWLAAGWLFGSFRSGIVRFYSWYDVTKKTSEGYLLRNNKTGGISYVDPFSQVAVLFIRFQCGL